jgi:hypothetical protein
MSKYIKLLLLVLFISQKKNNCSWFDRFDREDIAFFKDLAKILGGVFVIMVPTAYIKDKYWPTSPDPKTLEIERLKAEKKVLEDELRYFKNLERLKNEELVKEVQLSEKLHPEKAEDEQSHFLIQKKNDQVHQLHELFQMRQGQHNWKPWAQVKNMSNLFIREGKLFINKKIHKMDEQMKSEEQYWEIHNTFNV